MNIVIIIPCLNEEMTIVRVVKDCLRSLPQSKVYVFDNGSTDRTSEVAIGAGANVIHSPLRGKGNVLRQAFRLLDADYYVMIDGDGTYPVEFTPKMLDLAINHQYEMVTGARLEKGKAKAFRPLHFFGNHLFTHLIRTLFKHPVQDALTGHRVFSRRFVEEVHLFSKGFEVETELTVRAIMQDLSFKELSIPYEERPIGSRSKLRTFSDGWRILKTIVKLTQVFRPLSFYLTLSGLCFGSLLVALPLLGFEHPLTFISSVLTSVFVAMGFYFNSLLSLEKVRLAHSPNRNKDTAKPKIKKVS